MQQGSLPSSTEERMTPRVRVRLAAVTPVAVASLLVAGCAGGMAANRRSPGVIENGAFRPGRAPAASYGPDPSLTCPERGVNELVADAIGAVAKPEGRLCAIADTLLGWEGTGSDVPPDSVLAVISSDFGLPQPVRRVVIKDVNTAEGAEGSRGRVEGASEKDVAAMVVEAIEEERFLILTDPIAQTWIERKTSDLERWLRGMRRIQEHLNSLRRDR